MITKEVKLIEYTKKQDAANCITHGIGALITVICFILMLKKVIPGGNALHIVSVTVQGIALMAVYFISAIYHGLPQGEAKRRARLFDHMAIPLLLAGTTTPCALISLYAVSKVSGITVFVIAWTCAFFGIISKMFFFEKLKAAVMVAYFGGGAVMLGMAIPYASAFDRKGFALLFVGSFAYVIGGILCRVGMKRPWVHAVFHVFVLAGSLIHWYVIYTFIA